MMIKFIVILLVLIALYALGSGLYFLVKDQSGSERLVKALTWRIALSVSIFILLLVSFWMGWIRPHEVTS